MFTKSVYYNNLSKHHRKITIKWLQEMFNFDNSNKEGTFAFSVGAIFGWVYHLFIWDFQIWQFVIKGFEGVMFAVISGVSVKLGTDFYTIKIKPKIFKGKKSKIKKIKEIENQI